MQSVVQTPVVHCVDVFTSSWTRTNPNSLILSRFSVAACFMVRNNESLTARALSKLSSMYVVSKGVKFDVRKIVEIIWLRPNVKTDENDQSKSTTVMPITYLLHGAEFFLRS
jgi:hypothetical protein